MSRLWSKDKYEYEFSEDEWFTGSPRENLVICTKPLYRQKGGGDEAGVA